MDTSDIESSTERMVEVNNKEKENNEENDNYFFIVLFYFLGTACFVPQSFYSTANEYWMYKFRNTSIAFNETDTQKTTLQKNFYAYSGIFCNTGMVISLFATIYLRNKIRLQQRIIGSMISLLVLFTITMIFIYVDTDSWQTVFFVIALGISALLSSTTSVFLVSLFQMSIKFPPRCLAAQLAGQSVCGILAAVIQVLALLVGSSIKGTAALFYAIAVGTLAFILVAYTVVLYRSKQFQNKLNYKPSGAVAPAFKFDKAILMSALRKSALLIIAMVLCVGNTGILHTGLTVLIESSGKGTNIWSDTYFIPVCVFLLYPLFEFVGREGSNYPKILKNVYIIFGTSVIRLALFPLIILCNLQPRQHLPVLFHNDAFFIIFLILLAVSSGYILNIAIVAIPLLCEPNERMMATLLMVLVMVVFVPIFSVLSGVFVNII